MLIKLKSCCYVKEDKENNIQDCPSSMYKKLSEKLTFFTSWYVHVSMRVMEREALGF